MASCLSGAIFIPSGGLIGAVGTGLVSECVRSIAAIAAASADDKLGIVQPSCVQCVQLVSKLYIIKIDNSDLAHAQLTSRQLCGELKLLIWRDVCILYFFSGGAIGVLS